MKESEQELVKVVSRNTHSNLITLQATLALLLENISTTSSEINLKVKPDGVEVNEEEGLLSMIVMCSKDALPILEQLIKIFDQTEISNNFNSLEDAWNVIKNDLRPIRISELQEVISRQQVLKDNLSPVFMGALQTLHSSRYTQITFPNYQVESLFLSGKLDHIDNQQSNPIELREGQHAAIQKLIFTVLTGNILEITQHKAEASSAS